MSKSKNTLDVAYALVAKRLSKLAKDPFVLSFEMNRAHCDETVRIKTLYCMTPEIPLFRVSCETFENGVWRIDVFTTFGWKDGDKARTLYELLWTQTNN